MAVISTSTIAIACKSLIFLSVVVLGAAEGFVLSWFDVNSSPNTVKIIARKGNPTCLHLLEIGIICIIWLGFRWKNDNNQQH